VGHQPNEMERHVRIDELLRVAEGSFIFTQGLFETSDVACRGVAGHLTRKPDLEEDAGLLEMFRSLLRG
jgi:5-carboxymethyl-2-hydroxymuconate isomerase